MSKDVDLFLTGLTGKTDRELLGIEVPSSLLDKTTYELLEGSSVSFLKVELMIRFQLLLQIKGRFTDALAVRRKIALLPLHDRLWNLKMGLDSGKPIPQLFGVYKELLSGRNLGVLLSLVNLNRALRSRGSRNVRYVAQIRNPKFEDLITDRKVVILGPSPIVTPSHLNVEEFDTVIRPNIKGDNNYDKGDLFDRQTDVIYLNWKYSKKFRRDNYERLLSEGCYFVWRDDSSAQLVRNSHSQAYIEGLFVSGKLLMLPRIILDIITKRPKSVTIMGCDFYSGFTPYWANYTADVPDSDKWIPADHDLITNINFMNFLSEHLTTPFRYRGLEFASSNINVDEYCQIMSQKLKRN